MPAFQERIKNDQILLEVIVSKPRSKENSEDGQTNSESFTALLDTGATISAVSQRVIGKVGIQPISWIPVQGVHGTEDNATYLAGLGFR